MIREQFESEGKNISFCIWKPTDEVKGIVQISHGMAEHMLRYEPVARFLNENGYLVIGDDHRAHGETDRATLGYSDGDIYSLTLSDLGNITKYVKSLYPDKKVVLFGHSYGSFLTQGYIQNYGNLIDGVIIGGSAKMTGVVPFCGRMVANIGYSFKGGKAKANLIKKLTFDDYAKKLGNKSFISTISEEVERYEKDELCNFVCSYAFYKYFFKAFTRIYKKKNLEKINKDMPMLIMSGDKDPVGSFSKSTTNLYKMYQKLGVRNVELILYKNVYHEYLNDISREKAFTDILNFVNKICK